MLSQADAEKRDPMNINQILVIVVMNSLEKKSMPKEAVFNTVKVLNNFVF